MTCASIIVMKKQTSKFSSTDLFSHNLKNLNLEIWHEIKINGKNKNKNTCYHCFPLFVSFVDP